MKKGLVLVAVLAMLVIVIVSVSLAVTSKGIYKDDMPEPEAYIGTVSAEEILPIMRHLFSNASYKRLHGTRCYLTDDFKLVSKADFQNFLNWYLECKSLDPPPEPHFLITEFWGATVGNGWALTPVGFAVRAEDVPPSFIYGIFVTREYGKLVVYRFFPTGQLEKMTQADCTVKLVVMH